MCDEDKTSNSVQACSVLAHVVLVLVGVRRVTVVIVHIGHEDVVVVIYFCVAILFVICCIRRCNIISRLPGCDGQAANAVSASTQVKMEDAPKLLKIPKSECPDIWDPSTTTQNGQNHGPVWKTQSFLLSEICTVILWQDCYGKGKMRKSYCSTVGRMFQNGNAFSYIVKKG